MVVDHINLGPAVFGSEGKTAETLGLEPRVLFIRICCVGAFKAEKLRKQDVEPQGQPFFQKVVSIL